MYAELHSHTEYSNLKLPDSINKIDKLIKHAEKIGLSGVAVTDHECISGHIKAIQQAKKIRETNPDFKVILGNEIYLINESDYQNTDKFWHFLLLAKDKEGHKQLRQLSSRAWERSYYHKRLERTPTFYSDLSEVIGENKGHLIGSTACLGSFFSAIVLNDRLDIVESFLNWCVDLFGRENFFIEIQPGIDIQQIEYNKKAIQIAKQYNIDWIITNDVHYLTKEKRSIHAAYLNSKDEERETSDFYENTYFKTEDEMIERLSYLDKNDIIKGFKNTVKISYMVEFYDLQHDVIVPERKLPKFEVRHIFKDWYNKYSHIKDFAYSKYEQDRFLLYQIEKGFEFLKEEFNDENLNRINIELEQKKEISDKLKQRLSAYYVLVQKVIDIMWDDSLGNSIVPPGRGSTCGWYISYLLGISQIKPMDYNLPWWRHVHKSKVELSDIDIDSEQAKRQGIFEAIKKEFGYDNGLNIITFKTETSKAAVLTSCRGLGIDNDVAQEIADMIPMERGKVWSISDCINGNEEKNRKPIKEFINKVEQYPLLRETILEIEDLICGRSIHASGFYIFSNGYIEQNALMKAPNGKFITCWNMSDSDYCGALKIDCLTIAGADKIRKTLDLLLNDGVIEWQGSLRETYNKYLHPKVLEYKNKEMWDLLCKGEIVDLFQFDTIVGQQAIQKVKPQNLQEMMSANALMRLMPEDGRENPIDRYVKFKNDINLWYQEMKECGLKETEIETLKKYLGHSCGVCAEQEDLMELSMAEEIANFTFPQSNAFKSGVAKKKESKIKEAESLFYELGLANRCRKVFLDYIWEYCFKPQFGYSFSKNHDCPYSVIGLQEMNLVKRYGGLYWNTACLTINASANEDIEDNKSTNYGKIAKAIGDMQSNGVIVALPDINTADFGFKPDVKNNRIIFGLKGINGIGDDVVYEIIKNRPYNSLQEFVEKNEIGNAATINLIKAGCFDELEQKDRVKIMREFITLVTIKNNEKKTSLNLQNFSKVIELNILPENMDIYRRIFNFRRYTFSKQFEIEKDLYLLDTLSQNFFEQNYLSLLNENKDYWYKENGLAVSKKAFEKVYKKQMIKVAEWLQLQMNIDLFNQKVYNNYATDLWEKYCKGTISRWEMDSVSFYYHEHELKPVNRDNYNINNFFKLPSTPIVIDKIKRKNVEYNKYQLNKIVGTVLDRNKTKHYITLLTPEGVVTVKLYAGAFVHYDKQISVKREDGTKEVLEKSWFTRGNKLLVTGMRRNDQFVAKRYADSIFQHSVCLIKNVDEYGNLELQTERIKV